MNEPLAVAEQGHFWTGVSRPKSGRGAEQSGHMFVQYQIPAARRHPYPIVMVHGGGGQGLDFLATPDGRPGWATYFLRHGYSVYVVDRPGHGRARSNLASVHDSSAPTIEATAEVLCGSQEPHSPSASATQGPSPRLTSSSFVEQFFASQGSFRLDLAEYEQITQRAGVDLLDRIGAAIILTHSMGAPFGWLVADTRPDLVKAIIAVEPAGSPFSEFDPGLEVLKWGLTASPLSYEPPVRDPGEFRVALRSAPRQGLRDCLVQVEPARQLKRLRAMPVLIVTAPASPNSSIDHGTVDFLWQAGVAVEHLRLEGAGIHGNGHMMMLELNSDEIAGQLLTWLKRTIAPVD